MLPPDSKNWLVHSHSDVYYDQGYNSISIASAKLYSMGSLVFIVANDSASVPINRQSSLPYSDFDWQHSVAFNAGGTSKWASYLRLHTRASSPVVQTKDFSISFQKTFATAGTFNLAVRTDSCSNVSVTQSINVIDEASKKRPHSSGQNQESI